MTRNDNIIKFIGILLFICFLFLFSFRWQSKNRELPLFYVSDIYLYNDILNNFIVSGAVVNSSERYLRNPVIHCSLIAINGSTIANTEHKLFIDLPASQTYRFYDIPMFVGVGENSQGVSVTCGSRSAETLN